jgi:polar amino acid transport system substrate-binding protein
VKEDFRLVRIPGAALTVGSLRHLVIGRSFMVTRSKRLICVLAVASASSLVLLGSASGGGTHAVSAGSARVVQTNVLEEIKKSGVMKIGIALDPPLTLRTVSGQWYSIVPSLDYKLAQAWHVKVELVPETFTTIIAGLQAGKYDFIGASLNATPERKKVVDFTIPFSYAGTSYLVDKKYTNLNTIADLNSPDVTVAFQTGSSDDENTRRLLPKAHYRAIPGATVVDLVSEIQSGRSNALATANLLAPALLQKFPNWKVIPKDPNGVFPVGISWAVPKGQPQLLAALNSFLRAQYKNGYIKSLQTKYMTIANSLKG